MKADETAQKATASALAELETQPEPKPKRMRKLNTDELQRFDSQRTLILGEDVPGTPAYEAPETSDGPPVRTAAKSKASKPGQLEPKEKEKKSRKAGKDEGDEADKKAKKEKKSKKEKKDRKEKEDNRDEKPEETKPTTAISDGEDDGEEEFVPRNLDRLLAEAETQPAEMESDVPETPADLKSLREEMSNLSMENGFTLNTLETQETLVEPMIEELADKMKAADDTRPVATPQKAEAEKARKEAEEKEAEMARKEAEEKSAEKARKEAEEKEAEKARKEAEEKEAEKARKEAEEKSAEKARKEAEEKEAEKARKEAEENEAEKARKEAQEKEEAERARKEAEEKSVEKAGKEAEEKEAEKARKDAQEKEEAERARKEAEEKEAEKARKEAEEKEAEKARKEAEEKEAEKARKEAQEKEAEKARKEAEEKSAEKAKKQAEEKEAEKAKKEAQEKEETKEKKGTESKLLRSSTSMQAVSDILNRSHSMEMLSPAPSHVSLAGSDTASVPTPTGTLEKQTPAAVAPVEKKAEIPNPHTDLGGIPAEVSLAMVKPGGRKRSQEEREIHARRERFYRSLTSTLAVIFLYIFVIHFNFGCQKKSRNTVNDNRDISG